MILLRNKNVLKQFLDKCKPAVSRRTHFFVAALIWSVVGVVLLRKGMSWLGESEQYILVLPAFLIGMGKSYFILDGAAQKVADRIGDMQEKTFLGRVFSLASWLKIMAMILLGVLLRKLGFSGPIVGTIYCAIGWGLLFSSRKSWKCVLRR